MLKTYCLLLMVVSALPIAADAQTAVTERPEAAAMCARQAKAVGPKIIEWENEELMANTGARLSWSYTGHYNRELKRCVIETKASMPQSGTILDFSNIYDGYVGSFIAKLIVARKGDAKTVLKCLIFNKEVTEDEYQALMYQ